MQACPTPHVQRNGGRPPRSARVAVFLHAMVLHHARGRLATRGDVSRGQAPRGTPVSSIHRLARNLLVLAILGPARAQLTHRCIAAIQTPGASAKGCDFSYVDLRGWDLTGKIFESANFAGSDLSTAILADASLKFANLTDTTLDGTSFANAVVSGARFDRASCYGADFSGADARRDTSRAGKRGTRRTTFVGADCTSSIARGAIFDDADLRDATFQMAVMDEISLVGADLAGFDAGSASLHKARITENFGEVSAVGAIFDYADVSMAEIAHADFSCSAPAAGRK